MVGRFKSVQEGMVDSAYCGVADDNEARSQFNSTGFIGPWVFGVASRHACFERGSLDESQHITAQYCQYSSSNGLCDHR